MHLQMQVRGRKSSRQLLELDPGNKQALLSVLFLFAAAVRDTVSIFRSCPGNLLKYSSMTGQRAGQPAGTEERHDARAAGVASRETSWSSCAAGCCSRGGHGR